MGRAAECASRGRGGVRGGDAGLVVRIEGEQCTVERTAIEGAPENAVGPSPDGSILAVGEPSYRRRLHGPATPLLSLLVLTGCSSAAATPSERAPAETTGGAIAATRPNADALRSSCEGGDWEACNNLGLRYAEADGVERDDTLAFTLFMQACAGDSHEGCANAAYFYLEGRGTPVDTSASFALYERACAAGNGRACSDLGFLLVQSEDLARVARGYELLREACEQLRPRACSNLGMLYLGDRPPEGASAEGAVALLRRACTDGDGMGCRNLGILQFSGTGVAESPTDAAVSFERVCELGDLEACMGFGAMLVEGRYITADPARGRTFLERACTGGVADACSELER